MFQEQISTYLMGFKFKFIQIFIHLIQLINLNLFGFM